MGSTFTGFIRYSFIKKVLILFFTFIVHSIFSMDNPKNKGNPAAIPTLGQLCVNKIVYFVQTDERYNAILLYGIPHAHPFFEKLKKQLCTTHHIGILP